MSQTPDAPPTTPTTTLDTSIHCIRCGYDLIGLPANGVCPECGTHVEDSNRGTLLQYSAPEYLEKLHQGTVYILTAIIVYVLTMLLAILGSIIFGALGATASPLLIVVPMGLIGFVAMIGMAYGWWRFSEPDPKYAGVDKGDKPRQVLRIALITMVVLVTITTPISMFNAMPAQAAPAPTGAGATTQAATGFLELVLSFIQFVAYATWYFASMMYVQWIGARIPSDNVVRRARTLMWAGPLLMTVGACLVVGPLIAIVLYWNLLDWVRKDLKAIRGV
jgi:hypothetical protein